ncbi:MAG: hypothetical protein ACR2MX_09805 [Cyclobacteriaceae bacterium]
MEVSKSSPRPTYPFLIIPIVSLLICMLIVYVDEGNYSLKGFFDTQNIPALIIYFLGFNLMAFLIYRLVVIKFAPVWGLIAALILTFPLGVMFALVVFYIMSWFL